MSGRDTRPRLGRAPPTASAGRRLPPRPGAVFRLSRARGDEQVGVEPAAGVNLVWPAVDGVVVEGLHQRPWLTVDVLAADDQPQRLAGPETGARREGLDVERDDLTAPGLAFPRVGQDRLEWGRLLVV